MSTAGSTVPTASAVGAARSAPTLTEPAARTGRSVPAEADRLLGRYPRLDAVLGRPDGPDLDEAHLMPTRRPDR